MSARKAMDTVASQEASISTTRHRMLRAFSWISSLIIRTKSWKNCHSSSRVPSLLNSSVTSSRPSRKKNPPASAREMPFSSSFAPRIWKLFLGVMYSM